MRLNRMKTLFSIAMAVMLVVLAGCQSIQGLDISKALVKNATAQSGESNFSMSFELIPGDGANMTGKEQAMLELLKSMKLTFDSIKMQDATHMSAKGSLDLKNVKIPLQLAMDDQSITLHIDGAKKPIRLNLMAAAGQGALPEGMLNQWSGMQSQFQKLAPDLIAYFVKHFPDLKNVTLGTENATINGESLNLQKLHVELKGDELLGLFKELLTNMAKDEAGLAELFETLLPVIKEVMKSNPSMQQYAAFLENKELVKTVILPQIKSYLDQAIAGFDSLSEDLEFLNGLSLKFDLYIDSNLDIRKTAAEVSFMMPEELSQDSFKGFVVKTTSEQWNIGKPVTPDTIEGSANALKAEQMPLGQFVANFEKSSPFYKLLREDLNVTQTNLKLVLAENMEDAATGMGKPYKKNDKNSMVPTRELSQGLGADVQWDGSTKKITVTDYLSDKVIVLHVGSDIANVNGVDKKMPEAVEIVGDWSFVPVRFVATECGFQVEWNEDSQIVSISRD